METNERGKSICNIIPRNNNVLLKIVFRASIMALSSGKPDKNDEEKVTYIVAGIGPLVKDLDLGEEIIFKIHQEYDDIQVEGNKQSIKHLTKLYQEMKPADLNSLMRSGENKVTVIQYGMFPEFQIPAHIENRFAEGILPK